MSNGPAALSLSSLTHHRSRVLLLVSVVIFGVVAVIAHGPIPQTPGYHAFADQRRLLGIPNFWNVASNLPFLVVGLVGLLILRRRPTPGVLPALLPAYLAFFLGTVLVAIGSGYYHLSPSDKSLVWDRFPMAVTFMAFLAILIGEQIAPEIGARSLIPLLVVGILSVMYWWFTERQGGGDLRPYAIVQFLPMVLAPLLLLLFPSPLTRVSLLWDVLAAYALAKLLEILDGPIFKIIHAMSGHSLKHLVAALSAYLLVLASTKRTVRDRASLAADLQISRPTGSRVW
jgi:ceramidase